MKKISRLHYITTTPELAEKACAAGVDWIQLRLKNVTDAQYLSVAYEVGAVCRQYGAKLIINDNVQVAIDSGADGVHLGKTDMDPVKARQLLGTGKIIGCTAHNRTDIVRLAAKPVDYAGLGPFRFTTTKEKLAPIVGLQGYSRITQSLRELSIREIPLIAIGGIRTDDVPEILSRGIHGVAVSGAISSAEDVRAAAADFISVLNEKTKDQHG